MKPINVTGLDLDELIARLCNNTQPLGLGTLNILSSHTVTAENVSDHIAKLPKRKVRNFDYLFGRPLKVSFEIVDGQTLLSFWHLYDRDAGEGTAQRVVDGLRDA